MRTTSLHFLVACVLFSATPPARAWLEELDGASLPGPAWQYDESVGSGSTVVVDFTDPATGAAGRALRVSSGSDGYRDWFIGPFLDDEVVLAARFAVVAMTEAGKENLLSVTTISDTAAPAPSITIVDGRYKLWTYVLDDTEIMDLGPAVLNQFHTAFLYARKDGLVKLMWDGALVFNGPAPTPNLEFNGYVEWGSGSWQFDEADTVDYDWLLAAAGADVSLVWPPTLNIARQGNTAVISWPPEATGFTLQFTTNLPSGAWTDLSASGNSYSADLAGPARFYRLRR